MPDEALWSITDDAAPFGSDEGWESYFKHRRWRAHFPGENLARCIEWILQGRLDLYTERLLDAASIEKLASGDESDSLALRYRDAFTLDGTIIATALAQLVDEGRIDPEAKPFVRIALRRQLHPLVLADFIGADHRRWLLEGVAKAIDEA
jgi:hypothetical protein